jgi:hypothetical protein
MHILIKNLEAGCGCVVLLHCYHFKSHDQLCKSQNTDVVLHATHLRIGQWVGFGVDGLTRHFNRIKWGLPGLKSHFL